MEPINNYKTYERYGKDMILRDHLAVDRTALANERTLLSYLRTVVSFIIAGITLGKLLDGKERVYVVVILFVSAFIFAVYGVYNYVKVAKKLKFEQHI